jgi:hypothetical protein
MYNADKSSREATISAVSLVRMTESRKSSHRAPCNGMELVILGRSPVLACVSPWMMRPLSKGPRLTVLRTRYGSPGSRMILRREAGVVLRVSTRARSSVLKGELREPVPLVSDPIPAEMKTSELAEGKTGSICSRPSQPPLRTGKKVALHSWPSFSPLNACRRCLSQAMSSPMRQPGRMILAV